MVLTWPKKIVGGSGEQVYRNPKRTGFPKTETRGRFWSVTEIGGNVFVPGASWR
jgi:hypothetical protein